MQLEHAIVALWVLCSMLACWCFSLAVRWYSDGRARRLERLKSQYSPRSRLIAAVLMVVCLLGSVVAGVGADLLTKHGMVGGVRLTSFGAIGLGMLLFSCFLVVWALVGDRSRGRLRCPRCWYDMSDSDGRPCPECGKEISEARQLTRTRRPKWAFVVALMFLLVGLAGLGFNSKFRAGGVASFMPHEMLVSAWDRVPDAWIYDTGIGREQDNLVNRIYSNRISIEQRRVLATSVIDSMISDPMNRWEVRRMTLLHAIMRKELWADDDPQRSIWVPGDDRLGTLYTLCFADQLAYLNRDIKPLDDADFEMLLEDAILSQGYFTHSIVRLWLLADETARPENAYSFNQNFSPEQVRVLRGRLGEIVDELRATRDVSGYSDSDFGIYSIQSQLEMESGILAERSDTLMDLYEANPANASSQLLTAIYYSIRSNPDQEAWKPRIRSWLLDGDIDLRLAALKSIVSVLGFSYWSPWHHNEPVHVEFIDLIREHALGDDRFKEHKYNDEYVSEVAANTILQIDGTGAESFPILRDRLLASDLLGPYPEDMQYFLANARDERLRNWVETFEPQIDHAEPRVRLWIARSLPKARGTAMDDRLDAMIIQLRQDDDPIVQDEAWVKSMDRGVQ